MVDEGTQIDIACSTIVTACSAVVPNAAACFCSYVFETMGVSVAERGPPAWYCRRVRRLHRAQRTSRAQFAQAMNKPPPREREYLAKQFTGVGVQLGPRARCALQPALLCRRGG